jgi:hypothetical protein
MIRMNASRRARGAHATGVQFAATRRKHLKKRRSFGESPNEARESRAFPGNVLPRFFHFEINESSHVLR